MDENESNKRENSMLGPQGTGHAQNFAKGDPPLAVSGAEISRFQPEGHENFSRTEADHEKRVSDFVSTASDGSDALFPTSREQELLSVNVGGMVITKILNCSPHSQRSSTWTAIG